MENFSRLEASALQYNSRLFRSSDLIRESESRMEALKLSCEFTMACDLSGSSDDEYCGPYHEVIRWAIDDPVTKQPLKRPRLYYIVFLEPDDPRGNPTVVESKPLDEIPLKMRANAAQQLPSFALAFSEYLDSKYTELALQTEEGQDA